MRRTTGRAQSTATGLSISRYYDISPTPSRSLSADNPLGTTLALAYLPHELNGLLANQLTLFQSADGGATWAGQGATRRDPAAGLISRNYVGVLAGRWTLASPATPPPVAATTYAIQAFPVPFTHEGLSIQVTTATAGPLAVQLYDVLGRAIYNRAVASVAVGTSLVSPGRLGPASPRQVYFGSAPGHANCEAERGAGVGCGAGPRPSLHKPSASRSTTGGGQPRTLLR
ncbi:MAG: hypothetical protein WKG07_33075 [Hymenobacter sp.]